MTFREDLAENVCAMRPLWKALLGLEIVFLVLMAGAWVVGAGGQSETSLFVLNLIIIVPTTVGLVAVLRWCARREVDERELGEPRQ